MMTTGEAVGRARIRIVLVGILALVVLGTGLIALMTRGTDDGGEVATETQENTTTSSSAERTSTTRKATTTTESTVTTQPPTTAAPTTAAPTTAPTTAPPTTAAPTVAPQPPPTNPPTTSAPTPTTDPYDVDLELYCSDSGTVVIVGTFFTYRDTTMSGMTTDYGSKGSTYFTGGSVKGHIVDIDTGETSIPAGTVLLGFEWSGGRWEQNLSYAAKTCP